MKKILLSLLIANIIGGLALTAQSLSSQGINYQAVARDVTGQVLANKNIALKVSLSSKEGDQTKHYVEIHEITTDALGLFRIVVGRGKEATGKITEVPWAKEQIWLNIELDPVGGRAFTLVNSSELMSVPYAFHAATAAQLVENATEINLPTEKNQSIYWTTGGNTNTRPPTHFLGTKDNRDLIFKTDNVTRMKITADGLIRTYAVCADNGDQDTASYSIVAQGCKQGVYIKINGSRSGDNNFLTFADDDGIQGRVEGETTGELVTSFEYIWENTIFGIEITAYAADIIGLATELAVVEGQLLTALEGIGVAAQLAAATTRGLQLIAELIEYNINENLSVGVTYESGSGDYAEWLERMPGERDLLPAEVVGVKGGKITLNTAHVDHYMVVSLSPIVLGNMPEKGKEDRSEKVAFMGQVPVRVVGKTAIGDYILPSGNHDGLAIAVNPGNMKTGDYAHVIGVAWEASKKDVSISLINTAVGINQNDLSGKLEALELRVEDMSKKLDNMMAFLQGKTTTLDLNNTTTAATSPASALGMPTTTFDKMMSDEAFDQIIDNNAGILKPYYASIEQGLATKGYDLSQFPQIQAFFQNPLEAVKKLRRDPSLTTHWAGFDQKLKQKK